MKAGTENSIKFARLKRRLKLKTWEARGVLESLWAITAKNTPQGDIGRLSDEDIAVMMEWADDEATLVDALVESGWLDRDDEHRLLVHDWHEHAPTYIRGQLKRHNRPFLTGQPPDAPKETECTASDAPKEPPIERPATPKEPENTGSTAPTKPSQAKPSQAKPSQAKPSQAKPSQTNSIQTPARMAAPGFENRSAVSGGGGGDPPRQSPSIFEKLVTEDLRSVKRLRAWLAWQTKQVSPVFSGAELQANGERILRNVVGAAVRALAVADRPCHMFAWMVGKRDWAKISEDEEAKAIKRIKQYDREQQFQKR